MITSPLLVGVIAQLSISVSATDTVALNGMAEVRVRIVAPTVRGVELVTPSFRPFVLARSSARERVERDSRGRARGIVEYRYTLAPTAVGAFVIPAFRARLGGDSVYSARVHVIVRPGFATATSEPVIVSRARLDTGSLVNFRALAFPETVYVGQQTTYQLGVFIERSVRDRLRRMEAIAPEMRGMLAYEPAPPASNFPTRTEGARRYEAHVYQRAIFPLASGRHVVPPARLVYAMPLSYSFFSREEGFEILSDSTVIEVLEPPADGRPANYGGAVGSLTVSAHLDTAGARVGDPLSFMLRVSGTGNVKLLPRPVISIPWVSAVVAGERVKLDPSSPTIRGSKEFEWVLTPQRSGLVTLPSIDYPYFDPDSARYLVSSTVPQTLSVAPGVLARVDSGRATEMRRLALRKVYRGELSLPLYTRRGFWFVLAAAPLPTIALLARRRPRRVRRKLSAERALKVLANEPASQDSARAVRRTFLAAVAERLHVTVADIAEPTVLAHVARRRGATTDTAAAAAELLNELNIASFSPGTRMSSEVIGRAYQLYRKIDGEACRLESAPVAARLMLAALIGGVAVSIASAFTIEPGESQFARGVSAFVQGSYADAQREFSVLAARAPRSPDAWANLGTAAWAAGDTARAAVGWQRALRLEPLAADARRSLELLASSTGGYSGIPPAVPPAPVALAAGVMWLGGWLLLGLWAAHRRPQHVSFGLSLAAAAFVTGAAAATADAALAARDAAVIENGTLLRVVPALGGERVGAAYTGEVAHVIERRNGWARVVVDRARDGWMESSLLIPIARD